MALKMSSSRLTSPGPHSPLYSKGLATEPGHSEPWSHASDSCSSLSDSAPRPWTTPQLAIPMQRCICRESWAMTWRGDDIFFSRLYGGCMRVVNMSALHLRTSPTSFMTPTSVPPVTIQAFVLCTACSSAALMSARRHDG